MNDKFAKFGKKEPEAPQQLSLFFREMEMFMDCTVCNAEVDIAKYYPNESVLLWECELGHKSMIEGFSI